jgi:hypothetical protein
VTDTIKAGQSVAAFALPLSTSSFAHLADVVERLYGTGETMLQMDGGTIRITAPADGFGPIPRTPFPALPDAIEDEGSLVHAKAADGRIDITMEQAADTVYLLSESVRLWFDQVGGINYVEMRIQDDARNAEFAYIVQRTDKPTGHDLRVVAEAELAEAREEIRSLQHQLLLATNAANAVNA